MTGPRPTPKTSVDLRRHFEQAVRGLNFVAVAIAVLVLIGWQFNLDHLKSIVPGYITMKANTALGLLMLSTAAAIVGESRPGRLARSVAGLLALAAVTLGVLTLAEYLFSLEFGIDELLFVDPVGHSSNFPPGRLAPITALNLIFIGMAVARLAQQSSQSVKRLDFLVLTAFILAFQGFIGYVSGIAYTFGAAFYTQMALHTSIAFMFICLSLLFSGARQGFMGLLLADAAGGRLARRLVASALIVPPLVNWLQGLGQRAHLIDADFGVLLRLIGDTTFFLIVIWRTTSSLHLSDSERQASDAERLALSEALSAREQSERDMLLAREYAVEASRLKSEFLANMSHEIRTPINGVIGMAGLLADTQLTPQQAEYLEYIGRSADALLTVINDILDFSKVEAGKLELESLAFDLSQLIGDIGKTMSFNAKKKSLDFVFNAPEELQFLSIGDPGRVRQILLNLLSNAIKFTAHGRVELRVSVAEATATADVLLFEVQDTGIGMPEHVLPHLFSAFHQADASTTRRFGGTGLGLSICKKLIELMGGTLGVRSVEGEGSTFWFKLTLPRGASRVPPPAGPLASVAHDNQTSARILIAEDNVINQKVALALLAKFGYRAAAVANGREAVLALAEVDYDLVLMDCQMPEMDGFEATLQIRASDAVKNPAVPIIALTANAIVGVKERCLEVGMNDFISKPIKAAELSRVLELWLNHGGVLTQAEGDRDAA